ncbi:hypothetical protein MNBD_GAMMA10-2905 [hydrothermal vent metagenome]|uniref:DUF4124 domain-containing protein n=1 Tax=hydrothermal vent metagenome TaxID=652676 RepID=A0A3B0WXA4_9ZZZZ
MAKHPANLSKQTLWSVFLSALLCSTLSYAGIYKWTDEQGNVHYGEQRPTTSKAEKIDVQRYAPEDTSTYSRPGTEGGDKNATGKPAANQSADPQKDAGKEAEKKPETRAEKKKRLEACAKTRKSLKTMEEIGRVRVRDKDGNTSYLSQPQKEERMKKSRDMLAKHCK